VPTYDCMSRICTYHSFTFFVHKPVSLSPSSRPPCQRHLLPIRRRLALATTGRKAHIACEAKFVQFWGSGRSELTISLTTCEEDVEAAQVATDLLVQSALLALWPHFIMTEGVIEMHVIAGP
jgi:hypothetical protein